MTRTDRRGPTRGGTQCPFCGFPATCDCKLAGQGGCELVEEGNDTMCACCAIEDDAPNCCQPPRVRSKAKIALVEFLRPDGYWPQPLSIEQAFGTFQWMVRTGWDYKVRTQWGTRGVKEVLSRSSCVNIGQVSAITSLDDLRRRFHYALLSKHGLHGTDLWRREHKVLVDSVLWLRFPHYTPFIGPWPPGFGSEGGIKKAVDDLLEGSRGMKLAASLNSCHTDAQMVHRVVIEVTPRTFRFVLDYGFDLQPHDSYWLHNLAQTKDDEPFLATLARAQKALSDLKGG